MQQETSMIWVTFRKEGVHSFPEAAVSSILNTDDEYNVSFLAVPHRHVFHFKVYIQVMHDDRDIEFIQFKRWLENCYKQSILKLDNKSCEMIARELHATIAGKYPEREVWIDISEDGENGCLIKFPTFIY
jgi:hypothetical protein